MNASSKSEVELFKECYGSIKSPTPNNLVFLNDIPLEKSVRVGDQFVSAVTLTAESGVSFGTSGQAFLINASVSGQVRQLQIDSFEVVLPSLIPVGVLERGKDSESALERATKHIVNSNLRSHRRFLQNALIYGQTAAKLGRISYHTGDYRGATFTEGSGTLDSQVFGSLQFIHGVTSEGHILLAPGEFAAGLWVAKEGCPIEQLNENNDVVSSGNLESYDTELGIIKINSEPVPATSTSSHVLAYPGWASSFEMPGIQKILENTGTMFGLNAAKNATFRATNRVCGGTANSYALSFSRLMDVVADAINAGMSGDITVYCNPRSFKTLLSNQHALREHGAKKKSIGGHAALVFHYGEGTMTIKGTSLLKEGMCMGLKLDSWIRGGEEPSFKSQMSDMIRLVNLENCYEIRSRSDQFVFCSSPCSNFIITGINDEGI